MAAAPSLGGGTGQHDDVIGASASLDDDPLSSGHDSN
jgi:hypothetical protein